MTVEEEIILNLYVKRGLHLKPRRGEYGFTEESQSQGKITAKRGGKRHTVDALIQLKSI